MSICDKLVLLLVARLVSEIAILNKESCGYTEETPMELLNSPWHG